MASKCPKCGGAVRFSVVAATAEYKDDPEAVVKMRGSVLIDTEGGLRRLHVNERVSLPYGMMKAILETENEAVFYFIEQVDRSTFLTFYPQFEGWKL